MWSNSLTTTTTNRRNRKFFKCRNKINTNIMQPIILQRKCLLFAFSILLMSCCFQYSESLIVPQELPSILSLIYSNVPQLKKGTDSRLGFGFRLGEHADFQVILELGPQKETKPLGEQEGSDNSFSKRHVSKTDQRAILRQQFQQLQQQQNELQTSTERVAASWLENWSNDVNAANNKNRKIKPTKQQQTAKKQHVKGSPVAALPAAPVVAEQSLQQLQMLYKMATSSSTTTTDAPPQPIIGDDNTDESSSVTSVLAHSTPIFRRASLRLGGPAGFTAPPQELQLQLLQQQQQERKTKSEITKELMDVSLENEQQ